MTIVGAEDTSPLGEVSLGVAPLNLETVRSLVRADPWGRVRTVLVIAYGIGYVVWFVTEGLIIDRISVTISAALLLVLAHVGRPLRIWRRLLTDVALYVVMWLAYDESRGLADRIGLSLQVNSVRNIDRFVLFGHDAPVVLQTHFYDPQHVRWYDVAGSWVYFSHFWLPVAVLVTLWIRNRHQWVRFMRRMASLLFVACAMFVLVPTAPPWMAGGGDRQIRLDAIDPVQRISARGWRAIGLGGFAHSWEIAQGWSNRVAAMPSLHAGFALFMVVFAFPWISQRFGRVALLGFPAAMALTLAYFGEHWLIDAVAGWALVGLVFLAWNHIERGLRRRRLERSRAAAYGIVMTTT